MEGTEKPQTVDYTKCETSGKDLTDDGVSRKNNLTMFGMHLPGPEYKK